MGKKKILSIEDRIPNLKQKRKKKANRRLIFYLSIFFILISVIVYLQSPLSNIQTIEVKGNFLITDEEIIKRSNLSDRTNIWTIKQDKIKRAISENPIVESIELTRKLPNGVEIKIVEFKRVGYIQQDGEFLPLLADGMVLTTAQKTIGDAPLLFDFDDDAYIQTMASELNKLPKSILNLISEIYWKPTKENKNKIILYMNDGYIVDGTIRSFADKIQVYPSIVSQLEPGSKGIIHIGVGAYFETLANETDEESTSE